MIDMTGAPFSGQGWGTFHCAFTHLPGYRSPDWSTIANHDMPAGISMRSVFLKK